jgi:hypothetical protein
VVPLAGVGTAVISTAVAVHGANLTGNALSNIINKKGHPSGDTNPHGNTAGNQKAQLYEKYDKNGSFQKHGVSQDANTRYTKKELNGGATKVVRIGPRRKMLKLERGKVETNPGPENHEPWAGKKQVD